MLSHETVNFYALGFLPCCVFCLANIVCFTELIFPTNVHDAMP